MIFIHVLGLMGASVALSALLAGMALLTSRDGGQCIKAAFALAFISSILVPMVALASSQAEKLAAASFGFALTWVVYRAVARRHAPDVGDASIIRESESHRWPVSLGQKASQFVRLHWQGKLPLWRSYWVNFFLIQTSLFVASMLLSLKMSEWQARYASATALALIVAGVTTYLWALVGTWRSANSYLARGGGRFWPLLAQIILVVSVLRTSAQLPAIHQSIIELWKYAAGHQPGEPVKIEISADGRSVKFKGGLRDGASEELKLVLQSAPHVRSIELDSLGGWVREGKKVGEVIRKTKLSTYVARECSSACTIAFLAGARRELKETAKLGFHRFQSTVDPRWEFIDLGETTTTYRERKIPEAFIKKILKTPPSKAWYPTLEELLTAHVVTGVGERDTQRID